MDRESIAAGAAEQVRAILEAAEESAAVLRMEAEHAASEHVAQAREAADGTLRRLEELEHELAGLVETVRERVTAVLGELERTAAWPVPPPADDLGPETGEDDEDDMDEEADDAAAASGRPNAEPVLAVAPADADEAGARLIALNMALSGTPREETARYLAEQFSLADPDRLLDDVYAQAGR